MSVPELEMRDPQTYAIIGAGMAVSRALGHGFLEAVYRDAFAIELGLRSIPFEKEVTFNICYKGTLLESKYRSDFVCFGEVIVELKALARLSSVEESQVLNYLKASGMRRALLLNFGTEEMEFRRMVWNYHPGL